MRGRTRNQGQGLGTNGTNQQGCRQDQAGNDGGRGSIVRQSIGRGKGQGKSNNRQARGQCRKNGRQ